MYSRETVLRFQPRGLGHARPADRGGPEFRAQPARGLADQAFGTVLLRASGPTRPRSLARPGRPIAVPDPRPGTDAGGDETE